MCHVSIFCVMYLYSVLNICGLSHVFVVCPMHLYSASCIFTQQAEEDGVTDVDGSPLDIKEKLDPWVDQRGYPLVSVSRETVGDSRNVNFRQQHFIDPEDEFPESPFE